jgi:DNA (cytosine-5)-methyltransferase 1
MNHLDLFSGIGGFALAAKWAGIDTVAFCEIEPYAQKVLAKNFIGVPIFKDIKELKRSDINESIDIITGGFPCQPFSIAGRKKGTEDNRDLWPQMFRVIKEFKPAWVIGENVANFVSMAFQRTKTDLESEGYEVQPFIIPACGVNAPHRRDRVWIVGYAKHNGSFTTEKQRGIDKTGNNNKERKKEAFQLEGTGVRGNYEAMAYSRCTLLQGGIKQRESGMENKKQDAYINKRSGWWAIEPDVGRVAHGVPNRVDRLKGLGNAIVPQVAYQIMKGIKNE